MVLFIALISLSLLLEKGYEIDEQSARALIETMINLRGNLSLQHNSKQNRRVKHRAASKK